MDESLRKWLGQGRALFLFKLAEFKYKARNGQSARRKIRTYLAGNHVKKLHLGAKGIHLDGFLNTDVFGKVPMNIAKRLPFADGELDLIYSSHVVEHIYLNEFKHFLRESLRVLKPGGKNIMATPSIEKVARVLYGDDQSQIELLRARYEPTVNEKGFFPSQHINNLVHLNWGHKYVYDFAFIEYLGQEAGFASVESIDNFAVPDETVVIYLREAKPKRWDIETETFVLTK